MYFSVFKIVYLTGGTKTAYPHLIYIPMLTSSLLFGLTGGLLGGLLGGLILGIIPIDTAKMEIQTIMNITMRMYFLTFFGFLSGYVFQGIKNQYKKLEKTVNYDIVTYLPNRKLLVMDLERILEEKKELALTAVNIDNIMEIFNVVGLSKSDLVLKKIAAYLSKIKFDEKIKIYNSYSLRFEFLMKNYNDSEINGSRVLKIMLIIYLYL
jgi:hypothetical protein